jgi:hypothetical protein
LPSALRPASARVGTWTCARWAPILIGHRQYIGRRAGLVPKRPFPADRGIRRHLQRAAAPPAFSLRPTATPSSQFLESLTQLDLYDRRRCCRRPDKPLYRPAAPPASPAADCRPATPLPLAIGPRTDAKRRHAVPTRPLPLSSRRTAVPCPVTRPTRHRNLVLPPLTPLTLAKRGSVPAVNCHPSLLSRPGYQSCSTSRGPRRLSCFCVDNTRPMPTVTCRRPRPAALVVAVIAIGKKGSITTASA